MSFRSSLVDFHQHVGGLDVKDVAGSDPDGTDVVVQSGGGTRMEPPSTAVHSGTAASRATLVVVTVRRTEHLSVRDVVCGRRRRQRIPGVSAVPGRRQQVLARLVTDRERRCLAGSASQPRRQLPTRIVGNKRHYVRAETSANALLTFSIITSTSLLEGTNHTHT